MNKQNNPFYLLKGTVFRSSDNEKNLIEVNEIFQNKSLLEARKQAFSKLYSYIDVFLESIGKEYSTHCEAVKDLESFIKSSKVQFALNNPDLGKVDSDFDKGLTIYLVTDSSNIYRTKEGQIIYNNKIPVYAFSNSFHLDKELIYPGLEHEYLFYISNKLFHDDNERTDNSMSMPGTIKIKTVIKGDYEILASVLNGNRTPDKIINL